MDDGEIKRAIIEMRDKVDGMEQKVTEVHTVLFLNGLLRSTKDTQEKLGLFLEQRAATCPVMATKVTQSTLDRKTIAWVGLGIAVIASLPAWVFLIIEVL